MDPAAAARSRPDAPVVRLRERRAAHQRAPGVPRRLGARAWSSPTRCSATTPTSPRASWPSCAPAVVNVRALAEVGRAHRPRRLHPARPRRGADRRARQGVDPRRHRRGGDRRGLPRRGLRGRRPSSCTASFDPLMAEPATARRRPGLEDQPAGARRRAAALGVPAVRRRPRAAPTTTKTFTATVARRRRSTATASAAPRRSRAGSGRDGRGAGLAPRRPEPTPCRPRLTARSPCPSCPRSRSSAPASRRAVAGRTRRRASRCSTRAPLRRHVARHPADFAAALDRPPHRGRARGAASTSGCRSATAARDARPPRHERPAARPAARRRPTSRTCASGSPRASPTASSELRFVDQRTFGWLARPLVPTADAVGADGPCRVPPDRAHRPRPARPGVRRRTRSSPRSRRRASGVKRALLDQALVSGVGNIYADEALWRAGCTASGRPTR